MVFIDENESQYAKVHVELLLLVVLPSDMSAAPTGSFYLGLTCTSILVKKFGNGLTNNEMILLSITTSITGT